jgi:rRNA maturation protein Nop10
MAKKRYCEMCDAWVTKKECPECGAPTLVAPACQACEGEGSGPSWKIANCPACGGGGKMREPQA